MPRRRIRHGLQLERLERRGLLSGEAILTPVGHDEFYHDGDQVPPGGAGFEAFSTVSLNYLSSEQTFRFGIYQSIRNTTGDDDAHGFDLRAGVGGDAANPAPASYTLSVDGDRPDFVRPIRVDYTYISQYQTYRAPGGSISASIGAAVYLADGGDVILDKSATNAVPASRVGLWDLVEIDRAQGSFLAKTGDILSLKLRARTGGSTQKQDLDYVPTLDLKLTPLEVKPDLSIDSITPQAGPGQIAVDYSVNDWNLPAPGTISFFWSSDDVLDQGDAKIPGFDFETETAVGSYGGPIVYLPPAYERPANAHYAIVSIDAGAATDPDLANNVKAIPLSAAPGRPDLSVAPPSWNAGQGVALSYTITGADLNQPANVALYWSADGHFDPGQDEAAFAAPTQMTTGSYAVPVAHDSLNPPVAVANRAYLLAVIDPGNSVAESDEPNHPGDFGPNNVERLRQADLAAASLAWNTAQDGVDLAYGVSGADLPRDAEAMLYWAAGADFGDRIGTPIFTYPIAGSGRGVGVYTIPALSTAELLAGSSGGTVPAHATGLILVVDPPTTGRPRGAVDEEKDTDAANANNVAFLALPPCPVGGLATSDDNLPDDDPNNITAALAAAVGRFQAAVLAEPGTQTFSIRSGYRSPQRQAHFYEVSGKFGELKQQVGVESYLVGDHPQLRFRPGTAPTASALACHDLIDAVNQEIRRHGLFYNARTGRLNVNPPETSLHVRNPAEAVDIVVGGAIANERITQLALEAGLSRLTEDRSGDHVHYVLLNRAPVSPRGLEVGNGARVRGAANQLTVTLSGSISSAPADAFELTRRRGRSQVRVALAVVSITPTPEGTTVVKLRPSGRARNLADGNYEVVMRADRILDDLGRRIDGNADGVPGGDGVGKFRIVLGRRV